MAKKRRLGLAGLSLLGGLVLGNVDAYAQQVQSNSSRKICLYGYDSKWPLNSGAKWGVTRDLCVTYTPLDRITTSDTTVREYPFPPKSSSQEHRTENQQTKPNHIRSRCPEYSVSGDGFLLKDFVFNESGSSQNINEVLSCLYADRGVLSYDTVIGKKGLEKVISSLRSGVQTPDKKASITYLKELSKAISENTYMLILRSSAQQGYESKSLGILVRKDTKSITESKQEPVALEDTTKLGPEPEPIITEIQKPLVRITKDTLELLVPYDSLSSEQKEDFERKFALFSRNRDVREISPGHYVAITRPEKVKREREIPIRLTLDGILGQKGVLGGNFGLRYGPIGFSVGYANAQDFLTDSVNIELSKGRRGIGTERETGFRSLKIGTELYLWNFFLGSGVGFEDYTRVVDERIISSEGNVLKTSPTKSTTKSDLSKIIKGGIEIPIGAIGLRLAGGYTVGSVREGKFASVGASIRLNKQNKKQKR